MLSPSSSGVDDLAQPDDELVLGSRCHPDAATLAIYSKGELRIECAECGQQVVTVAAG